MSLRTHFTIYLNEFQHFLTRSMQKFPSQIKPNFETGQRCVSLFTVCIRGNLLNTQIWRMPRSLTLLDLYPMLQLHMTTYEMANCSPIHSNIPYIHHQSLILGDPRGSRDRTKISKAKVCSSEIFVPFQLSVPGSPRIPMPLKPYLCARYVPLLLDLHPLFALHIKLIELTAALIATSKLASKKSADGIHTDVIGMQKAASWTGLTTWNDRLKSRLKQKSKELEIRL